METSIKLLKLERSRVKEWKERCEKFGSTPEQLSRLQQSIDDYNSAIQILTEVQSGV